jgi:ribokinase
VGAEVDLVGCVGDDEDGRWLRSIAADEGIDGSLLATHRSLPTGSALIVVASDGANTVTVAPGANAAAAFADAALGPHDVVCAQLEVPAEAVAAALLAAHDAGARSVLNPSPIGVGVSLVPSADIVVVNEHEAAGLAGFAGDPIEQAQAIRTGDQTVVVTLGANGVVSASPSGNHVIAGIHVHPVDTTGAGDCFLGVLAASLAEGAELLAALERANLAAAIAVTRPGTVDAMPHAGDLLD